MQQDLTRREALKRGAGLVGAIAWAAPVVQVVGMSPAYAAQTSPVAEDCCIGPDGKSAKLATLTMKYLGGSNDCDTSSFIQDEGLVTCVDIPTPMVNPLPNPAFIVASNQEDIFNGDGTYPKPAARIWFEGSVAAGASFTALATNATETSLKGETWIHIFTYNGPAVPANYMPVAADYRQKVAFHTSCSEPLFTGDKFASVEIIGCTSEEKSNLASTEEKAAEPEGGVVDSNSIVEETTTTTTEPESQTTPEGGAVGVGGESVPPEGGDDSASAETPTDG